MCKEIDATLSKLWKDYQSQDQNDKNKAIFDIYNIMTPYINHLLKIYSIQPSDEEDVKMAAFTGVCSGLEKYTPQVSSLRKFIQMSIQYEVQKEIRRC